MFDLTAIRAQGLEGWLLADFRGSNILAQRILQFADGTMGSRRWMYFVPGGVALLEVSNHEGRATACQLWDKQC